jgi:hypothetical protein
MEVKETYKRPQEKMHEELPADFDVAMLPADKMAPALRVKYTSIMESQVIQPLMQELTTYRAQLETELKALPSEVEDSEIVRTGLNIELVKVNKAIAGIEAGFEMLKAVQFNALPNDPEALRKTLAVNA